MPRPGGLTLADRWETVMGRSSCFTRSVFLFRVQEMPGPKIQLLSVFPKLTRGLCRIHIYRPLYDWPTVVMRSALG
jgi:hypothetical protein